MFKCTSEQCVRVPVQFEEFFNFNTNVATACCYPDKEIIWNTIDNRGAHDGEEEEVVATDVPSKEAKPFTIGLRMTNQKRTKKKKSNTICKAIIAANITKHIAKENI